MEIHEEYDEQSMSDLNYDAESELDSHRKNIRRLVDEQLDRKRLQDEFKDDFDEITGEFDWDSLDN